MEAASSGPTHEQRHPDRIAGEPHDGLPRRVPSADDDHMRSGTAQGFARSCSVVDPGTEQLVDSGHGQASPLHPARQQEGPSEDGRAIGQMRDVPRTLRRNADERPGEEYLCAESTSLSDGAGGQLASADAVGKAQVVLDHRGRTRLAAGSDGFEDQCPKALGCRVDSGREAGWAGTDNGQVVFRERGTRHHSEAGGDLFERRGGDLRAVGEHADRERSCVNLGAPEDSTHSLRVRDVDPFVLAAVAAQEVADPVRRRRCCRIDQHDAWRRGSSVVVEQGHGCSCLGTRWSEMDVVEVGGVPSHGASDSG